MQAADSVTVQPGSNQFSNKLSEQHGSPFVVTIAMAAKEAKVSRSLVICASAVKKHGVPELASAVRSGDVSVNTAAKIARLPKTKQHNAIAEAIKSPNIVDQALPASNSGLTQVGAAFRVRGKDRKTAELAVFECRCGRREIFLLFQVRSKKAKSCGCMRYATQGKRYKIDVDLMRMRFAAGIPVQASWIVQDDAAAIDALLTDVGRAPDGQVLCMIEPAIGWLCANVRWNWPETAMKQQQTAAMQRMATAGTTTDELWTAESARLKRARQKRINDFPISATIIDRCPLCQGHNIKRLYQRETFHRYQCHECHKEFSIRKPIAEKV